MRELKLMSFDWLNVYIKEGQMVLSLHNGEVDEDLLKALIQEGILIDCE